MPQIEITAQAWPIGLLLAFTLIMLIGLIYACVQMVASRVRHFLNTQASNRVTKRRSQEIRAIGRSARQNMQELYDDYLAQVTQAKRR